MKPGLYEHYKGGLYRAVCYVSHSETHEGMVLYKSMKNKTWWVRPSKMFDDNVEFPDIGGSYVLPRYRRLPWWQQLLLFWKR